MERERSRGVGRKEKVLVLLSESLGTFIIIYSVALIESGYGIALGVWIAITLTDKISGAHLNPAVTLAILLDQWLSPVTALLYIIAQMLGGFLAALLAVPFTDPIKSLNPDFSALYLEYFSELILTFFLVLQIIICHDPQASSWQISFLIAGTVGMCIAMASPEYGGCLNPSVGFSINLIYYIFTGETAPLKKVWVYVLGPFSGALVALFVKKVFYCPACKIIKEMNKNNEYKQLNFGKGKIIYI